MNMISTKGAIMQVKPYLYFDGRTEEAIEFYKKAMGAKVEFMLRFKDAPQGVKTTTPNLAEKVIHSTFRIGDSVLNASDGDCGGKAKFSGISLALTVKSETEAEQIFAALQEGGQVQMPMTKTFFSPKFGMVADKFGVSWLIHMVP
jgi:PhnB protein